MIVRSHVFDDDHLPSSLAHRDAEESELVRAFEPAADGSRAADVLIHGPSGVGKTTLARHTLDKLTALSDVNYAHIQCQDKSTAGIIRSILRECPGPNPAQNTPKEDLCIQLRDRVNDPVVVVLDEAEQVPSTDVLDRLTDVGPLSLVVICHNQDDWLARVEGDVHRRLVGNGLPLDRYGVDELADILEARARHGLLPSIVTRTQLEEIADTVAGVARFGIQSLREAALLAEERGHRDLLDDDIVDAYPRARKRIRKANLDSMSYHGQVLYELIRRSGGIGPSALHDRYEAVANDTYYGVDLLPVGDRQRRTELGKLEDYYLIERRGENRHLEYLACDESIEAPISLNAPA